MVCTWSSSVQISLSAPREGRPTTNLSTHFKHTLGLTVTVKPTQQSSRACVSAKLLSCVRLFATPRTVAPLSMGFSRQEYWSGLPCPPPGDLPKSGIKPRSPALQADSLPSEPQGKPKNTGVGGVCLLQGIFLTQKLNWGLLHCRWILYQLNYQRSP